MFLNENTKLYTSSLMEVLLFFSILSNYLRKDFSSKSFLYFSSVFIFYRKLFKCTKFKSYFVVKNFMQYFVHIRRYWLECDSKLTKEEKMNNLKSIRRLTDFIFTCFTERYAIFLNRKNDIKNISCCSTYSEL